MCAQPSELVGAAAGLGVEDEHAPAAGAERVPLRRGPAADAPPVGVVARTAVAPLVVSGGGGGAAGEAAVGGVVARPEFLCRSRVVDVAEVEQAVDAPRRE